MADGNKAYDFSQSNAESSPNVESSTGRLIKSCFTKNKIIAYLSLTVLGLSGVIAWREVSPAVEPDEKVETGKQGIRYITIFDQFFSYEFNQHQFVLVQLYIYTLVGACGNGERNRYFATFHNSDRYPIDVIWMDSNGAENVMKSKLDPQNEFTNETYFRQSWKFRRSANKEILMVQANEVEGKSFEGCQFQADADEIIRVRISGGKLFHYSQIFSIGGNKI